VHYKLNNSDLSASSYGSQEKSAVTNEKREGLNATELNARAETRAECKHPVDASMHF